MANRGGRAGPSGAPPEDEWKAEYFRAIPELEELARSASLFLAKIRPLSSL